MLVSVGGSNTYIKWPINPISMEVFDKVKSLVYSSNDYRVLRGKRLKIFQGISPAAISIRNAVLKGKIISNYHKMNKNIKKYSAEYSKWDITELSKKYDFPPLGLLRGILLETGHKSSDIYKVFAGREDPEKYLKGYDLVQYKLAIRKDAEHSFVQTELAAIAAKNELLVVEYFRGLFPIKTQDDLVAEQVKDHGRAVATPDILFTTTVYVNGKRVYWLDFKDYTGTTVGFIYRSNLEQAGRYVAKWGPGIMCYRGNYIENVKIPDVILVSAEHLPINFINFIV